jgi:hypothetical protein
MITEDYVSFEVAKLLKEHGFNSKTEMCYLETNPQLCTSNTYPKDKVIYAPSLSLALKWLRTLGVFLDIFHYNCGFAPFVWLIFAYNKLEPQKAKTYEEAEENALEFILENWDDIFKVLKDYYKNDSLLPKI